MKSVRRIIVHPLWLIALAVAACSSESPQTSGNGAASMGGTASAVGTATGGSLSKPTGVGDASPAELVDACVTFRTAQCQRMQQCEALSYNCLADTLACPDDLFAVGSGLSLSQVTDCAKQFSTLPCDAATQWRYPACITAGTRAARQSCMHDLQCQSLLCDKGSGCGECAAVTQPGDDCYANTACPVGHYCSDALKCVPFSAAPPRSEADAGASVAKPTLGMSCAETLTCDETSYCDGENCLARPGKAALCAPNILTGDPTWCATGLACNGQTGFCETPPGVGEKCMLGPGFNVQVTWICEQGLRCSTYDNPVMCRSYVGMACTTSNECGAKAVCACDDGTLTPCRGTSCIQLSLAGEPCGAPGELCHPAYSCENNVCVPKASQGLFKEFCKN